MNPNTCKESEVGMLENAIDNRHQIRHKPRSPQAALFNPIVALERLDGDAELFVMLVSMYHQDSSELVQQLNAALEHGDLTAVERAAHSLKGLAANLEAIRAKEAASIVEECAHGGDLAGAILASRDLHLQLQRLANALAEWHAASSV
jgi:two-component system sensor histidine kinase/response regulator